MTWAEFCIRQHAYRRMEKQSWYKVREIAYSAMIGSHMDPKKLPKSKELFIPLDGGEKRQKQVTDVMRAAMKKAADDYNKNKKNG